MRREKRKSTDQFQLIKVTKKKKRDKEKQELLELLKIKEFFPDGKIDIEKKTCQGIECRLCIKTCPTHALFWQTGQVGISQELCIYCGACILNCIVDGCIRITRRRANGGVETFSNPREFLALQNNINADKRLEKIRDAFPTTDGCLGDCLQKKLKSQK